MGYYEWFGRSGVVTLQGWPVAMWWSVNGTVILPYRLRGVVIQRTNAPTELATAVVVIVLGRTGDVVLGSILVEGAAVPGVPRRIEVR